MRVYVDNQEIAEGRGNLSEGLGSVKIPLTILTYNRPFYLDKTLDSFIRMNYDCLDSFYPIILNQGTDEDTELVVQDYSDFIKEYHKKENKGCAAGYSFINSKYLSFPYLMHLQDDWYSTEPLSQYLDEIFRLFENNRNVGYIRLRSIHSRVCKRNRISTLPIEYKKWPKEDIFSNILVGNAHWTFNPTIIRTEVLRKMLPVSKELDSMKKFHQLGMQSAQLDANCFSHIGIDRALTNVKGKKVWIK